MAVRTAALMLSLIVGGAIGATAAGEIPSAAQGGLVQLVQYGNGTWVRCASEDTYCSVPYPTTVRYGANGRYYSMPVNGWVFCSNQIFGDPNHGVGKTCDFLALGVEQPG